MKNFIKPCLAALLLTACVRTEYLTRTEYQEVYIPQPCTVEEPTLPLKAEESALALADIREYIKEIRKAFRACKGELP